MFGCLPDFLRKSLVLLLFLVGALFYQRSSFADQSTPPSKPNFIIIFTDDQGYQDLGCFGSPDIRTPNIDQLAKEGMRLTNFYAQTVCGPSRAALMTGCYPLRVAKKEGTREQIHPYLHGSEITIAELLKDQGYATACFGKWDLAGHRQQGYDKTLLPTRQGFDYFFGTPTSNDSIANLLRNEDVIEPKVDMATLTKRYTDEAIKFIRANKQSPFFVYMPHTMPHLRLAASKPFRGQSTRGLYGDVIEEIDFQTGRLVEEIKQLGLSDNTYLVFTSDNGPWYIDRHPRLKQQRDAGGSHGGSSAPLRGHKTSAWEGGVRVPCIVWAPGRVPAGTSCREVAMTMDLLPTFVNLAGGQVPQDRVIDGEDIRELLHGDLSPDQPSRSFFYYVHTQLMAVRSGNWKLHLPRKVNTMKRWDVFHKESDVIDHRKPLLINLADDPSEQQNLAAEHPEVVAKLLALAEEARDQIGDHDRTGKTAR
jgi:arylsulfatase